MRREDKVVLITGAGSGIDEATANTFARERETIVVGDIDEEDGNGVVADIRTAQGTAEFCRAHGGEPAEIERMIAFTTDRLYVLDKCVLHGCRSYCGYDARSLKNPDVSLTGYWYAIKIALRHMLRQGKGSIINTSSVSLLAGDRTLGAYNAVKAGVVNIQEVTGIESSKRAKASAAKLSFPVQS